MGKPSAANWHAKALRQLEGEQPDPANYLVERMASYAVSPRGKGEFAWEPVAWLRDGHWADDDAAWQENRGNGESEDRVKPMSGEEWEHFGEEPEPEPKQEPQPTPLEGTGNEPF